MRKKRLGEILVERGHVSNADVDQAIQDQHGKLIRLGELLVQRGLVSKADLGEALTEVTGIAYESCDRVVPDLGLLKSLPFSLATRCCALPIRFEGTTKIIVAMAEPQNLPAIDELRFSTGLEIIPRFAFRDDILSAIAQWYGGLEQQGTTPPGGASSAGEATSKIATTADVVTSLIVAAMEKGATDIYLEPHRQDAAIRMRIDGVLRDYQRMPRAVHDSAVSRVKILSGLDTTEHRGIQDGQLLMKVGSQKVDMRVSTLPAPSGEGLILRLRGTGGPPPSLSALGFPTEMIDTLDGILADGRGILLVAGPTGSGRTTTLYSTLIRLRDREVKIVTVEEAVECAIPRIMQTQVNAKSGLTLASCVRLALRQEPQVLMLPEIRDPETAEIAFLASESRRIVLSTLHTNDSVSALTRLIEMGVPGPQLAASLKGVIGQRLVRRLCECRREVPASDGFLARLREFGVEDRPRTELIPGACEQCDGTGFRGRIAVQEILVLSDSWRSALRSGDFHSGMRTWARRHGLRPMHECALDRVLDGLTTLDEVRRVVPFDKVMAAQCPTCKNEIAPAFVYCPHCGEQTGGEKHRPQGRRQSSVTQGALRG